MLGTAIVNKDGRVDCTAGSRQNGQISSTNSGGASSRGRTAAIHGELHEKALRKSEANGQTLYSVAAPTSRLLRGLELCLLLHGVREGGNLASRRPQERVVPSSGRAVRALDRESLTSPRSGESLP